MSREGLKLSLLENNNNNNGVPTLTTPTLTPTTLRNIEQMLLDSGDAPVLACEPPELHENAAGFVPPSVDIPGPYEPPPPPHQCTDRLQSSLDWVLSQQQTQLAPPSEGGPFHLSPTPPVPPVIASLIKDPSAAALPGPTNILLPLLSNLTPVASMNNNNNTIITSSANSSPSIVPCTSNDENSSHQQDNQNSCNNINDNNNHLALPNNNFSSNSKKRGSSSRRSSFNNVNNSGSESSQQQLTPEEKLKRDLRRERNKEAAARCRKRRLDQTLNLQDEVEELDSKKMSLQKELETLRAQRDKLESLLNNHKAGQCSMLHHQQRKAEEPRIKKEPLEESPICIKVERSGGLEESSSNLACTVGGQ